MEKPYQTYYSSHIGFVHCIETIFGLQVGLQKYIVFSVCKYHGSQAPSVLIEGAKHTAHTNTALLQMTLVCASVYALCIQYIHYHITCSDKRISHTSHHIVHSECRGLCVTVTLTMKCTKIKSLTRAKQNDSLLKANLIKNTGVNDCHLQKGKVTMLQICIDSTNYNSYHYCVRLFWTIMILICICTGWECYSC